MRVNALLFGREEMLNETKYSRCDGCGERCRGCEICGYVFVCVCYPCHEGLLEEDLNEKE